MAQEFREHLAQVRGVIANVHREMLAIIRSAVRRVGDKDLVRCRLNSRIKRLDSFSEKASQYGWKPEQAIDRMEDLIGFRLVCNNVQDVRRTAAAVSAAISETGSHVRVRDYISEPKADGYRAMHLLTRRRSISCEIQILSLLQHTWGELSHSDLYKSGASVPERLKGGMKRLAEKLAAADRAADLLRTGLSRPRAGRSPKGGRKPTAASISRLYEAAFSEHPPDYLVGLTLDGIRGLKLRHDAVENALSSTNLRKRIESAYERILGVTPEPGDTFRWIVHWVATAESPVVQAVAQAKRAAQELLAESSAYFTREVLAELPDDWRDIVSMIDECGSDGVEDVIHGWANALGGATQDFWTLERAVYADSLAMAVAHHYRLRGRKYDEAVEVLTRAIGRSEVLLA